MRINIASKNSAKVEAVSEIINDYELLRNSEISSLSVDSGTSKQPKSIDETIQGAMTRAKNAFNGCEYSFGIESGFMGVPNTKTGFMNITACAIYNGTEYHIGLSSAFECPHVVTEKIFNEGIDLNQAYYAAGLTEDREIGHSVGVIYELTKHRLSRKEYTKEAVRMALIQLENPKLYES